MVSGVFIFHKCLKPERFLDQKYFLEIALENDYKKKEEMAKANERVLRIGNRKV